MAGRIKDFSKLLVIFLVLAHPALVWGVTPPIPAHPAQYVVDLAGVLDASAQSRLNAMLKDLEAKTTAQVVVLTLNSLEGEPIENFSHQTAVKWGIGQKGKDNGVLLTVAVKDKKYRLEVGYGLESTLPDSLVGTIGRQYLVPHFRKGDFAGGIIAAITDIAQKIAGPQAGETPAREASRAAGTQETRGPSSSFLFSPFTVILFIIFMIMLIIAIFSSRRRGGGFWFFGSGGGWSSGGGGSGGFSGGGGDFGGGGASGDW